MSCPLNSHYNSCGTACPATCQDPFSSRPCVLACVESCQCDPGFVLDGNTCVPMSQCGCTHNGYHYHSNQTFWADKGCTQRCICVPHTHEIQCFSDSCTLDEYCAFEDGIRQCVMHPRQTCLYTTHRIVSFDQQDYDFHGTCWYQLLNICGKKQGLDAIQVHTQTDGHLESALHVLVNVSGVLVKLNSKDVGNIEVGVSVSLLCSFHYYLMIKLKFTCGRCCPVLFFSNVILAPPTGQWCQEEHALSTEPHCTGLLFGPAQLHRHRRGL